MINKNLRQRWCFPFLKSQLHINHQQYSSISSCIRSLHFTTQNVILELVPRIDTKAITKAKKVTLFPTGCGYKIVNSQMESYIFSLFCKFMLSPFTDKTFFVLCLVPNVAIVSGMSLSADRSVFSNVSLQSLLLPDRDSNPWYTTLEL